MNIGIGKPGGLKACPVGSGENSDPGSLGRDNASGCYLHLQIPYHILLAVAKSHLPLSITLGHLVAGTLMV